MARTLTAAQRTGEMVIRERDIGTMLRIERHLEEIEQIAISAAEGSSGRDRSRVDNVIAGSELREFRGRGVAIHALTHIDIPLGPAVICAVRASALHDGRVVRITGEIRAKPYDYYVPVGIGRDPRKHVGLPDGRSLID